jgi:hypothetical protein
MNVNPDAAASGDDQLMSLALRMRSLRQGGLAVLDAVTAGAAAIPVLRELLFEKDSAGIFEPRKRAVQALAALGASGVLKEFVVRWQPASDPIERLGDEAVLGAAAVALAETGDEEAYLILSDIAREHPIPGVVEALSRYRRVESIPVLIAALADDCAGAAAEQGLRSIGQEAVPALVDAAVFVTTGPSGRETPSSIRRRRRVFHMLYELGATREAWDRVRESIKDQNDEIAALACKIGVSVAGDMQMRECAGQLVELLRRVRWPIRQEIEECLIDNFGSVRESILQALHEVSETRPLEIGSARFMQSLRKIVWRATARNGARR